MAIDETQTSDELRFGELLALLWNSRLLIATVTAFSLIIGLAAFILLPRTFVSKVSVVPLSQAEFAGYLDLAQEGKRSQDKDNERPSGDGAFPYTPVTLHAEFSSYLRDYDRLAAVIADTGVVDRGTLDDDTYNQQIRRFISDIKFELPKAAEIANGQHFLNVEAKADNRDKLLAFMRQALTRANADLVHDLVTEIRKRAEAIKNQSDAEVARLEVDAKARRERAGNERSDETLRIAEQSAIAHALGIQKPLDLRAIEAVEQGGTAPAQINNSGGPQPPYLQGYVVLDKRIEMLRSRKDADPFIEDLRKIEQQIYLAKNNPRPARMLALLKASPLADPSTAKLARFSIASIIPEKIFPKLSVFGLGALLAGLLLGSVIAFVRREIARHPES